jgi:hypothetical protein
MSDYRVVHELERRFLPSLYNMAEEISQKFPNVKVDVWSHSVGSKTEYQGHNIGIDCRLSNVNPDQVDNVALIIDVRHLTTAPEIAYAEVCWGHPSGYLEAELLEAPADFDDSLLGILEDGLQELHSALCAALERGHPLE